MNIEQINEISSLSSGTIGNALKTNKYTEIDSFIKWLYKPLINDILWGYLPAYGDNCLVALHNAITCYKKYYKQLS